MARKLTPEQRERKRQRDRDYYARKRAAAGLSYHPKTKPSAIPQSSKSGVNRRRKSKPKPPVKGVSFSPKERKSSEPFLQYAARHLQANPKASARKILQAYHDQGGQISNDKGYKLVRELKESDKNFEKVRFKMYGPHDHPDVGPSGNIKKFLFPKRYMYRVQYQVIAEDWPTPLTQHTSIVSDFPLTPSQIAVQAINDFQVGQEKGRERYIAKRILPNTIRILWGVDRFKKSAS